MELCVAVCFGAGSRDVEDDWGRRGCNEEVEVRAAGLDPRIEFALENKFELKLEPRFEPKFEPSVELTFDAIDKPELYDLR